MSENQEVTHTQSTALSTQTERRGFESPASQEDFEIPRAKLFHGLPTEYEEYPNAKPGQILNNITKEALPEFFIPILRNIQWIRFNPRSMKRKDGSMDPNFDTNYDPSAMIWQSSNPNDPRVIKEGAWGANGEPPVATKFLSFLSYFPGVNMPVIVSFSKTSFKAGKKFNTMLTFNTGDMWANKFSLKGKLEKSGENSFYVFDTNGAGRASDEEVAICENLFEQFKSRPIVVDAPTPVAEFE